MANIPPNIPRTIEKNIKKRLFKGKIIVLYGARQVGKTTLVKNLLSAYPDHSIYLSCDEPDIRAALTNKTSTELKHFFGHNTLIVIDEAQRVHNIGLTLKLVADNFPDLQIIATGSSSFELANSIIEPLTGRSYQFHLYPLSLDELRLYYDDRTVQRLLERWMIYGLYPEIVLQKQADQANALMSLSQSYVYKDILAFQRIQHSEALEKLLQALALQVGNEVSYNELSQMIGIDKNTVQHYIEILEQAFIIFKLPPFSRNLRNELKKLRKIYFYDNGIRNALINNFNPLERRNDTGALWENFMLSERLKWNQARQSLNRMFFWRTHSQQEIDLIEESAGTFAAFEFKWKKQSYKLPRLFLEQYAPTRIALIHRDNFFDILS